MSKEFGKRPPDSSPHVEKRLRIEATRSLPWFPFRNQEQKDRFKAEVLAPYADRVQNLKPPRFDQPETDPKVELGKKTGYTKLLQTVFPHLSETDISGVVEDPEKLNDFTNVVKQNLALCTTEEVRPDNIQEDNKGRITANYGRRDIITPRQGESLIESFGLEAGSPITFNTQAEKYGCTAQSVRSHKFYAETKLQASLTSSRFLEEHSLPLPKDYTK